jgi:ankyrin repeat protein
MLSVVTSAGRNALHHALSVHTFTHEDESTEATRLSIVEYLVSADENLLNVTDIEGNTPLHIAAKDRLDDDIIEFLLEKSDAEVLGMQNLEGDTVLHLCVRAETGEDIIETLVDSNPAALGLQDGRGPFPAVLWWRLHAALEVSLRRRVYQGQTRAMLHSHLQPHRWR